MLLRTWYEFTRYSTKLIRWLTIHMRCRSAVYTGVLVRFIGQRERTRIFAHLHPAPQLGTVMIPRGRDPSKFPLSAAVYN